MATPTLPPGSAVDPALIRAIAGDCERLADNYYLLNDRLGAAVDGRQYDAAVHVARALVIAQRGALLRTRPELLLDFLQRYGPRRELVRVARALARDRSVYTRRRAHRLLLKHDRASIGGPWDFTSWIADRKKRRLARHPTGAQVQAARGLPPMETVAELRQTLGIPTRGQLGFLLRSTDRDGGPYRCFTIKKADGSDRSIAAPRRQLREVQRRILRQILDKVPPHPAAHGFVTGRSTVTNAAAHLGQAVLLKFDLVDFFPSVHVFRVAGLFASLGYAACPALPSTEDDARQVGAVLARLCSYGAEGLDRSPAAAYAPQGAPTSPALCNLVCRKLDARLAGLVGKMGGVYTRYADDLSISFARDPGPALGRLRWWVEEICTQEGFRVNQRKFRVTRRTQRQVVTGIVVNDTLRVPRAERRRFRAILHNCQRHGVASQARDRANFQDWLRGYAAYIHMVHPDEGTALLAQVDALLGASP